MATIIKVQHGDDLRRLNITHYQSYADFTELVRTIFNITNLSGLRLAYKDETGDWINIRSEMDMAEARRVASVAPSFKIHALISDGISSAPQSSEPLYPQIAPEDIDLTNSFAELLSDSMQKVEPSREVSPSAVQEKAKPSKVAEQSESKQTEAEATFHQHLDELSESENGLGVLDTVESKFKRALEALVEFMESLQLDQKVRRVVSELEPSFAKFDARVIKPLNDLGMRASRGLQEEITQFQAEMNLLKERLNKRLEEFKVQSNSSAPSAPVDESMKPARASVPVVIPAPQPASLPPHNAMHDLHQLESMGFTDRRRNLELLALHKGNVNAVIEVLLA